MALAACWLLFPLVLAALCLGCGLLLERASGRRLGVLAIPVGLGVLIVVAGLLTMADATAELATPAVVVLAALGFAAGGAWWRRLDWAALGAAAAVFAVFAAPVVLSGEATFTGFIKLDDTATFLAMADRVMEHGRSIGGLPPSSHEATLEINLTRGYPLGSLLPLGVGGKIVRQDLAWLWQPTHAFYAAVLALVLYALLGGLVRSRLLGALAAFLGAQPALLYGYALWGGIKELAAASLVALVAVLAARRVQGWRELLPLAVTCAAVLGVLSLGGAVWLAPALLPLLLAGRRVLVPAAVALALAAPALTAAGDFLRDANADSFQSDAELGNLVEPLSWLELFGVWLSGDFRVEPADAGPTLMLIAIVALAAAAGLGYALRARRLALPLYLASALVGCAVFAGLGSPWVGAKALAMASPAVLGLAVAGAAAAWERGRRVEAGLAGVAILVGVLWSNAYQYGEAFFAPRATLRELEAIGERYAGQGPALMTEYSPYGVRWFLRRLDPEGASELRRRVVPLRGGGSLGKGETVDVDRLDLGGMLVYRTLVLRRGPGASRPPSAYALVRRGRFYDVWQQRPAPLIVEHVPLGTGLDPGAPAACGEVTRLAGVGEVVAAAAPPGAVRVGDDGTFTVPVDGRYELWLGGSFRGRVEARVGGVRVGSERNQLNWSGSWTPLATATLTAGGHRAELRYSESSLRPGRAAPVGAFGPLVVAPAPADAPVLRVERPEALCGQRLDWLEALAR